MKDRPELPRSAAPVAAARGRVEVVATPIGNLADLSPRARESLQRADLVAAEDTRRTGQLLAAFGIERPIVSLHTHNERARSADLLARLAEGVTIALVSDAGTPVLSDPGFELVRSAAAAGHEIVAIPGPTAIAAALAISGLPVERFCFEGFLPARPRERRARLAELAAETRAMVFFEGPHRLAESLVDMAAAFGADREAIVARELTKAFETVYRGTLAELGMRVTADPNMTRGELTLVVAGLGRGAPGQEGDAAQEAAARLALERTLRVLLRELAPSKAAALAAQLTGARRSDAYALALSIAESTPG
ncbi:MAG: 16S rRNA (cytidine(1402)-2'-O)-methyltransferase [Steroidobacteraceae bacterium]